MPSEFVESLISNGFAVAVAAFLLIRLEREIKDLRIAIDGLRRCQVCKVGDAPPRVGINE